MIPLNFIRYIIKALIKLDYATQKLAKTVYKFLNPDNIQSLLLKIVFPIRAHETCVLPI